MNRPKTSVNLTIGTNKNVAPDSRGRNLDRMDEAPKTLATGRTNRNWFEDIRRMFNYEGQ